jgi:glycosyltransferase involved in cell wall biosynthesis
MTTKNDLPLVSIIIPCRDEEKFIGKCLDSIVAQDYLKERLEILVFDRYYQGYFAFLNNS